MRLDEHERQVREMLAKAGVDSPGLCARILTAHAAGLDRTSYVVLRDGHLPEERARLLHTLANRRSRGEPLAYILGKKAFFEHDFLVTASTLVPRPETELLVETALSFLSSASPVRLVDLGCGCGCIGLSLLAQRPQWQGILLDNSLPALEVTKKNAESFGISVCCILGDIYKLPFACDSCDLLISNPPYIAREEEKWVMNETLAYEPHCALFSPENGLSHIMAIIRQAKNILRPDGLLILEHGFRQGNRIMELLHSARFKNPQILPDLSGLPRCAVAWN